MRLYTKNWKCLLCTKQLIYLFMYIVYVSVDVFVYVFVYVYMSYYSVSCQFAGISITLNRLKLKLFSSYANLFNFKSSMRLMRFVVYFLD